MATTKFILLLLFITIYESNAQLKLSTDKKKFDKLFDSIKKSIEKNVSSDSQKAKKEAVFLAKIARTPLQKINSLKALGEIYDIEDKLDSSGYCYANEFEIAKKYYAFKDIYYQAVIDYVGWGKFNSNYEYFMTILTEAMLQVDSVKNRNELIRMYLLLGDIFFNQRNYEKAQFYYDKYGDLLGKNSISMDFFLRKGMLNLAISDYKAANKNFEKAISSCKKTDLYYKAFLLNHLGFVNYKLKNFGIAKKLLNEALVIQKMNKYNDLNEITYLYMAFLYKVDRDYISEKKCLDSAKICTTKELTSLKPLYYAYADYYSRMMDFDKEQYYVELFTKVDESINNKEIHRTKLRLETIYQLNENKKKLLFNQNMLDKESKKKQLYLVIAFILLFFSILIFWVWRKKFKTQKKLIENQISLHEQSLKLMQENQRTEIIKEKIKAKMEERGKLSLELHDGIANEIASLKMSISSEKELDQAKIESVINKVDKLYNEVRNLSHDLDPDNIADVEFSQLVDNLCLMTEKNGLKTEKNILISKNVDALDENILINIYRILQEAVNNTIKHAAATEVKIDVIESDEELHLAVQDNGKGFRNSNNKPGIGLKNIEKRVNLLKGICKISNSTAGTTVDIKIPKNKLLLG